MMRMTVMAVIMMRKVTITTVLLIVMITRIMVMTMVQVTTTMTPMQAYDESTGQPLPRCIGKPRWNERKKKIQFDHGCCSVAGSP